MHPEIEMAYADMLRLSIPVAVFKAYQAQFHNCKRRAIGFKFTLPEWWAWWTSNGWELRLQRKRMMLRNGDKGDYDPSNVYCGTVSENSLEANTHPTERQRTTWARFGAHAWRTAAL
jgi:hypothetical protein